ncbi:MAG: carbohydrate-binding protein [Oscillospiraceae bacterium]|jgi:hypothetical protein|nr:carbohydrate-binding protein [Oscillospiraceae bacterium]
MLRKFKKFLAVFLAAAMVSVPSPGRVIAAAETAEGSLYTFDTGGGSQFYAVDLTANGDVDWFQLSQNSETNYAKKADGAGLYGFRRDNSAVANPSAGAFGYIDDGRITFSATDADATAPAIKDRYGLTIRGVGNYLEFKVKASAQTRVLSVYSGNWRGTARLDFIVGDNTLYSTSFSNADHNAVFRINIVVLPGTQDAIVRQTLTADNVGGGNGSTFIFAASLSNKFAIDKTNIAVRAGDSETITALPGSGVAWSSSAPGVASVDAAGKVTGVKAGDAVITAALGGVERTCAVKVVSATSEVLANGYVIDMSDLPKVRFTEHPEWEEIYNATWQIHKSNIKRAGVGMNPEQPYFVDAAFSEYIYAWDTLFMMMFDKWGMNQFPVLTSLDNFYMNQYDTDDESDGYISREINATTGSDRWSPTGGFNGLGYADIRSTNPPLWAWAEWENYMIHGDVSRFDKVIKGKTVFERLVAHYNFIERVKKLENGLYGKQNGYGNGLDNTYNQGAPYDGSNPESNGDQTYNDLSLQQAQFAWYLAKIAGAMGKTQDEAFFKSEHARISKLISDKMWDENTKMFSNLDADGVTHTNVSTPTTLWALAAHVATPQQAADLISYHGNNSQKMFRPYGLATTAYDDPRYVPGGGYWRGAYWAPTSYQYIKGLEENGYTDLEFEEAIRHLTSVSGVYQAGKTGKNGVSVASVWENYSSEYLKQGIDAGSRSNFAGWTGCLSVGIILEDVIGVRMNAPENAINWNIRLAEEHGVSDLWMQHNGAQNRVSLTAQKRVSAKDPVTVTVTADRAFTLNVKNGAVETSFSVPAGTSQWSVDGESGAAARLNVIVGGYNPDATGFKPAAFAASGDWVRFGSSVNASVVDGLKQQVRKGSGLIANVNTIGYSQASSTNPPAYRASGELGALGVTDAMEAVKSPSSKGAEGFMFTVPATNNLQTVTMLVGVTGGEAELSALLLDGSVPETIVKLTGGAAESVYEVHIPYRAAADGHRLLVKFTHTATSGSAKIALKGIALNAGGVIAAPQNFTLTPENAAIAVNAACPAGEEYDAWVIRYGTSPDSLAESVTADSMPHTIGDLTNGRRYYVSVAGVTDGKEGLRTGVLYTIPEEKPLSDEERATIDLNAAIPLILNGNPALSVKSWLAAITSGPVYESEIVWSSNTDGQYPGIWNTGEVERPVGRSLPTQITVTSTFGGATVAKTVSVIAPAVDFDNDAYVLDTTVSRYTGNVYLTQEGTKDWLQVMQAVNGTNAQARKSGGSGLGLPRYGGNPGWMGVQSDVNSLTHVYTDAGSTAPVNNRGFGIAYGGYIEFDVSYSAKAQRLNVYFAANKAKLQLDFIVNGIVRASETVGESGYYGPFRVGFDFKLDDSTDQATVRLTLIDGANYGTTAGNAILCAMTLAEKPSVHPVPQMNSVDLPAASTASFNNGTVNLTAEGTLDWWQFYQGVGNNDDKTRVDNYARKLDGSGLYGFQRNHDTSAANQEQGYVTDTLISYTATAGDVDPSYPAPLSKYGMQCRGVGNGFQFNVAPSDKPRVLTIYTGNWNGIATTEVTADGQTRYSKVTDNTGHGVYRHVIYIAAGEAALVKHTLTSMKATGYSGSSGSTFILAVTLADYSLDYGTNIPAELFANKVFRADQPNIENCTSGGKNIGGIVAGAWLTYNIDVETAGVYRLALEYAAQSATNPGLTLLLDNRPIGSVEQITATGNWQSWAYKTVELELPAGIHELKLAYANAGTNLRSLNFKYLKAAELPATSAAVDVSDGFAEAAFTIGNPSQEALETVCIVAFYDADSRLVSTLQRDAAVDGNGSVRFDVILPFAEASVKAFIWDAKTYTPLCAAAAAE